MIARDRWPFNVNTFSLYVSVVLFHVLTIRVNAFSYNYAKSASETVKYDRFILFSKIIMEDDDQGKFHSLNLRRHHITENLRNLKDGCEKFGKKLRPVALAFFTSAIVTRSPIYMLQRPTIHPPAAHASAPIVPIKRYKPPKQKEETLNRMKTQQDQEKLKAAMAHQVKLEEIEAEYGAEARAEYEKKYEAEKAHQAEEKATRRKQLMYNLVGKGICPFVDVEGVRQMYLFDRGIDLNQVPASPQNKEAKVLSRYPNLAKQRAKQRFIVKCVVDDLVLRGKDPLTFLKTHTDSTSKILSLQDQELDALVEKYSQLIRSRGSISGVIADKPFDVSAEISGVAVTPQKPVHDKKTMEKLKAAEKEAARALEKKKKEETKKAEQIARALEKQKKEEEKRMKEEARKQELESKKVTSYQQEEDEYEEENDEEGLMDEEEYNGDGEEEDEVDESEDTSALRTEVSSDISPVDTSQQTKGSPVTVIPIATVAGIGGGAYLVKILKEKSAQAEEERKRQFQLIMGLDDKETKKNNKKQLKGEGYEEEDDDNDDLSSLMPSQEKDSIKQNRTSEIKDIAIPATPMPVSTASDPTKKRLRIGGITSVFSKKASSNREIDLKNLLVPDAFAPKFSTLLAKLLTFGAPGRFPFVAALPGGMPLDSFDLEKAKELLVASRDQEDLTSEEAAEAFASVVNCMIIDIIELASSSLGFKEKKDKAIVDALNVVLDFMDHAASLYDAIAEGIVIKPVTYGGTLSKAKLEEMFSIYAASMLTNLDGNITQSRVDTLQLVFNINDKRAEGLIQKATMKNLMSMMKNGGEGMEGMDGLSAMLAGLNNGDGGIPGLGGDGELKPEDLKQSINMMKELIESGSVSKDEIDVVRKQFKDTYGKPLHVDF